MADDGSAYEQIEAAAHALDGQKLTAFTLDASARQSTFAFDLGAVLTTWPYEFSDDEQWMLYLPGKCVLTYRADGFFSFGPDDLVPGNEVWQAVPQSVSVP